MISTTRYKDFLKSGNVKKICTVFSHLTGLIIDIDDINGNLIAAHGERNYENPFCAAIRAEKSERLQCAKCTKAEIAKSVERGGCAVYTCRFSFTEIVIPIIVNNEYICSLLTGQFFQSDEEKSAFDSHIPYLSKKGFDINNMRALYHSSRVIAPDMLEAIIDFLKIIFENLLQSLNLKMHIYENSRQHQAVARAVSYVQGHLSDKIPLSDAAKHVNLSPFYFNRLFKEETGCSFLEYCTVSKINKAKELLLAGSVIETSLELGYSSLAHFTRLFRKYTGFSPGIYRKARKQKLLEKKK